ncbi:MAG TPA: ATP-binding cassette domain-containing protein [Candidatus Faecousia intestinigallinarum]|nr:ATP-binding cassette domain-containing protein [Candidatus Faecousia intestinigallinarum]
MLELKNIVKTYPIGGGKVEALKGVSVSFRSNEFVAILGPSGCGKTTLLNIIGGLDRYDSGELTINGISTKEYKDRDWDSYRNHTVGFVFQSYNLIPHQTVLSNVELALTISGISKAERRKRAIQALVQVGLGEQLNKRPSQMSGGQMQRVAIARALVNNPDILLADEPTGALDSETSVQVMELLKEVARDRLVVMVTHNPDLAEAYATRIVRLKDGQISADTAPFVPENHGQTAPVHKNMGKASMSFLTALSLSFHNLRTKKARTLLTSFAGSIGIIGIALILALSNGVNAYIQSVEQTTLSEYPLQIQSAGMDMASMMASMGGGEKEHDSASDGDVRVSKMITTMLSKVDPNDLASLKDFLDSGDSGIEPYANAVEYTYDVSPQIYRLEGGGVRQVNPDNSFAALGMGSSASGNSMMSMMMSTDVFHEMPENTGLYESQYDVKAGRWPESYNECVVVLTARGSISDFMLYTLGLRDSLELDDMVQRFLEGEPVEMPDDIRGYSYDELLGIQFKLVNPADYYVYDDVYDVWRDKSEDAAYMRQLVSQGENITIVGVVQPKEDATAAMLDFGIGYPAALTRHVMELAENSAIVQQQLAQPTVNVLTGNSFGEENNQDKFQMESLFTINEDALRQAFSFDPDALDMDISGYFDFDVQDFDFSGIGDFSDLELELPELPGMDLETLLGQLDITIAPEHLQTMAADLLQGYQAYAAAHPEADYSQLYQDFLNYLQTPEAQGRLLDGLQEIAVEISVDPARLEALVQEIMSGFQEYAQANGFTDPDKFNEYLLMYLQTPEAQQKILESAGEIVQVDGDISISQEALEALAQDLAAGYQEYAAAHGLPDPSKMGEHFIAYLQTDQAKQIVFAGMSQAVDLPGLEAQITEALGGYMESVTSAYMQAVSQAIQAQITSAMGQAMTQMSGSVQSGMNQAMGQLSAQLEKAFQIDPEAFADAIQINMSEEDLAELLRTLMSAERTSYEGNLKKLGYADPDDPLQINIYPKDFESKASILQVLEDYNARMEAAGQTEKTIRYTDFVGTLMSSVTEIVDVISYVLVAFVAISLIVSSIMIGVITYISVLERKKEIGILRAIGASKRNISQVFNAETFIIGLCAGLIGIGLTLLILIPGNALIHSLAGSADINAILPPAAGVLLIALSVLLTLLGGVIPSRKAAKSDPVAALRAE